MTKALTEKVDYLLGSWLFWVFVSVTTGVLTKLIFFSKDWDILELALILIWRYVVGKIQYGKDILIVSVGVIIAFMPILLAFNETIVSGGLAIWIFYLLIWEIVASVRKAIT